jgi:hypothetical protein
MIHLDKVTIAKAIIHKVGNPTRAEQLQLSNNTITLNDGLVQQLLIKYFLSPFNQLEQYQFTHQSNLAMNEVYTYCLEAFKNPTLFIEKSAQIAQFLYNKSTHVKVKEGELYVVYFENLAFNNGFTEAIGLFKSESRETFLKVFEQEQNWEITAEDGIDIKKLDKGALIYKQNDATGFVLNVVDNTNKQNDARYWLTDFLQVESIQNNYKQTQDTLQFCKQFITQEYANKFESSKPEQIDLLSRSVEYFKTNPQFSLTDFAKEVIHHTEVVDAFEEYKNNYQVANNVQLENNFDIHLNAVKRNEKFFKAVLKLDKNFHIYIHGRRDLVERGYDEVAQKSFYKLYYDEES